MLTNKIINSIRSIKTFGESMFPLLKNGDICLLEKANFSRIRVDDIVTAKRNDKLFTHRVIYKSIDGKYLITKGDHNEYVDKKIYPKDLIGRVVKVKRNGQVIDPEQIYFYQSSIYFKEILKVNQILSAKKINFVFLKGLPLYIHFLKKIPKRIYADCDLLIEKQDFNKTKKIFNELGYEEINDDLSNVHKKIKKNIQEISFGKKVKGMSVIFDVHLEVVFLMTQLSGLDLIYPQKMINEMSKKFLDEQKIVRIDDEHFPILSIENLLLYLSLHLLHHNYKGIYRYDLLNKLFNKKYNVQKLTDKIIYYKLKNFVYPVFIFLKIFFNTPLDKNFIQAILPNTQVLSYIRKNVLTINIFEDEKSIRAGVNRFKFIFYLSPVPKNKRILVFTKLNVWYSIFWVLFKKTIFKVRTLKVSS